MNALQERILASASRLVKPGGRLVYGTCSLLSDENEQIVQRFLDAHPHFSLLPVSEIGLPGLEALNQHEHAAVGMLKLRPDIHRTDGFFAAAMVREKNAPES